MISGKLSCPKCGELGMGNFDQWETRLNSLGQKQWLFYRQIIVKKSWRCWALLTKCDRKYPKKWYDPCGCCFNPCKGTIHTTTYVDGYGIQHTESNSGFVCFCIMMKWLFLYMLYYTIFIFYFMIFFWYDIFYCFFEEQVFYEVFNGNRVITIRETEELGIWYGIPNEGFTEEYWNNYGKNNIFRCNKCSFISNSFQDFVGNKIREVIINNPINEHLKNTESQTNLNVNNFAKEPNSQGDVINAHFISEDKSINQFIQSSSKELFSSLLEKFFGIYPDLRNKICIFTYNRKIMEPKLTLEQNNYKSGEEILTTISGQN